MPFELLQKPPVRVRIQLRLDTIYQTLALVSKWMPTVLIAMINDYSFEEEEDFNLAGELTRPQKAKLLLITFASLFKTASLAPSAPVEIKHLTSLPEVVLAQHRSMGLEVKNAQVPAYHQRLSTEKAKFESIQKFKEVLRIIGENRSDAEQKQNKFNMLSLINQILPGDEKCFDGQQLIDSYGRENRLYYHTPFQLIIAVEIAKQAVRAEMIKQEYNREPLWYYLTIVKNLEKLRLLYKDLGYMDLELSTLYISEETAQIICNYTAARESKYFIKTFNPLEKLRLALILEGIRCPQLEYNLAGGYVGVFSDNAIGKINQIPGVVNFNDKRCENESLTAAEFLKKMSEIMLEQDGAKVTLPAKVAVLERWVTLLQRVYNDLPDGDLHKVKAEINNKSSSVSEFLLVKSGIFTKFSMQSSNDSHNLAKHFVDERIKDVGKMKAKLITKLPELFKSEQDSSSQSTPLPGLNS
jgi:hypothetical protein